MGVERVKIYFRRLLKKDLVLLDKFYFKDKCYVNVLDLLGKMFKLDSKERIFVGEVLVYSYLKEYYCIDDEFLCFLLFEFDFEDFFFIKDDLKVRILKEIE